jgi:Fe-S cluster assembly scaffold protein SufB
MGPISDEELWYLATRGIPKNQAQQLIISGFFQKGIDMLDDESMRQELFQSVSDAI